jgi:glutamate carboxypeptidase
MLTVEDFRTEMDESVSLLTRLVEIESPSTDKAAVDRLGEEIIQELSKLGASVTVDEQSAVGNHIIGRWGASTRDGHILLLCHMDTVYDIGTLRQRPLRVEDGKLFGPGTLDMKASIAMLFSALRQLQKSGLWPQRPITTVFTSDEEIGSNTSRSLIEKLAAQAALTLCLEAALPDGSLKTARKGTGDIEIVTRGKAAHAGVDHKKGRNAIEELAYHILSVQRLTDYERGTTVSVGKVSGGSRTNVVPDEARAMVDIRVADPEEAERIQEWVHSLKPVLEGTSVSARLRLDRPPMMRDATMVATFQKVCAIASQLGIKLSEGSTGGGSDANFVAALGVPVMDGLGAMGDGAHSEGEYVWMNSLPERTALLTAILTEY